MVTQIGRCDVPVHGIAAYVPPRIYTQNISPQDEFKPVNRPTTGDRMGEVTSQ